MSLHETGSLKPALEAAEAAIERYERLQTAIRGEVENITGAVQTMYELGREARNANVEVALGDGSPIAAAKADKAYRESCGAVEGIGQRLEGLRGRMLDVVGQDMPPLFETLSAALPGYGEAVERAFAAEWAEAVRAFSEVLGRRAELERMVGRRFDLPEAQPADVPVEGEALRPYKAVESIKRAIEKAASEARSARSGLNTKESMPDPHTVYKLIHKSNGLPEGTLLVAATLPRGVLANLIAIDWARPMRDAEYDEKLRRAEKVKRGMERVEQDARDAELQAERRREAQERNQFVSKYFPEER